uniref:Uncharacterized protein n=1 Tax=Plectus sambesii TaxID=2011161 RepID=A0A914W1T0_9BILA
MLQRSRGSKGEEDLCAPVSDGNSLGVLLTSIRHSVADAMRDRRTHRLARRRPSLAPRRAVRRRFFYDSGNYRSLSDGMETGWRRGRLGGAAGLTSSGQSAVTRKEGGRGKEGRRRWSVVGRRPSTRFW